jgi:hypothetical protein
METYQSDGYNETMGAKADAAITDATQSGSVVSWLKGLLSDLNSILALFTGGTAKVTLSQSNITYATPAHTVLGVTAASQVALAANANRKYAVLQNDSVNDIYLFLGAGPAVANKGIRLNAGGGSYELRSADGSLYTGAVYAIAAVAGPSNLLITEGV